MNRRPVSPTRSRSRTPTKSQARSQQSKYLQESQAKNRQQFIHNMTDNRFYKNIMNQLLRINTLKEFLSKALEYVRLTEDFVDGIVVETRDMIRSRAESPQNLDHALKADGSFVKHYCRLAEKHLPDRKEEIRSHFYERYNRQIIIHEGQFTKYFKEYAHSQSCSRLKSQHYSRSKLKTLKTTKDTKSEPVDIFVRERPKELENLSAIDHAQSRSLTSVSASKTAKSCQHSKRIRNPEVSHEEQVSQTYTSPTFFKSKRKEETSEEREERFLGFVSESCLKSNTKKNKEKMTVTFDDELKSNSKLGQIFDSIVKERQARTEIKKNNQPEERPKYAGEEAIVRTQIQKSVEKASNVKVRQMTERDVQGLGEVEREVVEKWGPLELRASREGVLVGEEMLVCRYKGCAIKKATATDLYQFSEPTYKALIIQPLSGTTRQPEASELPAYQRFDLLLID